MQEAEPLDDIPAPTGLESVPESVVSIRQSNTDLLGTAAGRGASGSFCLPFLTIVQRPALDQCTKLACAKTRERSNSIFVSE